MSVVYKLSMSKREFHSHCYVAGMEPQRGHVVLFGQKAIIENKNYSLERLVLKVSTIVSM